MTKRFFLPVFLLVIACFLSLLSFAHNKDSLQSKSLEFIENKGQWNENVCFQANLDAGRMFLEKNAISYLFYDQEAVHNLLHFKLLGFEEKKKRNIPKDSIDFHAYRMHFSNANPNCIVFGKYEKHDYNNYYLGNNPKKWASSVKKFHEVIYTNLYEGIDLRLYQDNHLLKYDFHIKEGANPKMIEMYYEAVDNIAIVSGNLQIQTKISKVIELKPYAYQIDDNGNKIAVPCKFRLKKNTVSFVFPKSYDKTKELIIDPVLIFSSYSGSTADNWGYTATYDLEGHLYAGGNAFGIGYPTTLGAYQTSYAGNSSDIVISKYDSSGTFMLFSTYLGGSGTEVPNSLIVNNNNELFVLGTSGSSNYPTTPGAYDNTFNGGTAYTLTFVLQYPNGSDIVISRFKPDGTALLASTYFGGSGNDGLNSASALKHNYADDIRGEIMIDKNNNCYIASTTHSSNFPITPNAFQTTSGGGQDGCIFKLDNNLTNLLWSSYLGGSGSDAVYSIVIDEQDNIYVSGGTTSSNFPTTSGVLMPNPLGGTADGFVTHIAQNGNNILHSSYWGTSAYDQAYFVELDKNQNVHLLGQTAGPANDLIYNATWNMPGGGQFISKLSPQLNSLIWSTRFGTGNGIDISPTAFLVDLCNNIYISGWGSPSLNGFGGTNGMPITANAFQSTTDNNDYYFMSIADDASALTYGSFFGGSSAEHVDGGTSRFDKMGRIYQAVCAGCGGYDDFPTTPGAWSNTNNSSNCNNGVIKFDFNLPVVIADFDAPLICLPDSTFFDNNSYTPGGGLTTFYWDFGDGNSSTQTNPIHQYGQSGIYLVTLIAGDAGSCNLADTITKHVVVLSNYRDTLPDEHICIGSYTHLGILPFVDTSITYQWTPATGLNATDIPNPIANPNTTTTYELVISNGVCTDTLVQKLNVYDIQVFAGNDTTICNDSITITAHGSGADTVYYQWSSNPNFTDTLNANKNDPSARVFNNASTTYYVRAYNDYCENYDSIVVSLTIIANPILLIPPSCHSYCDGKAWVTASGGNLPYTYQWSTGTNSDTIFNVCEGYYDVTITDAIGCFGYQTVYMNQPSPIYSSVVTTDIPCDSACIGTATVGAGGSNPPYNYLWSNGQTTNPASSLCEGTYTVTISDTKGCEKLDTAEIMMNYVFQGVQVWQDDDTIYQGQKTYIHATSITNCSYSWEPTTGLDNPYAPSTGASPTTTTTYILTIIDPYGCVYKDTLIIYVKDVFCEDPYIYVPNAFSPDGDGINDILYVRTPFAEQLYFAIFNRWGEVIFETTDIEVGWDGTYKGKKLDPGVFVYYLEVGCYNKEQFKKKGNVTLIR